MIDCWAHVGGAGDGGGGRTPCAVRPCRPHAACSSLQPHPCAAVQLHLQHPRPISAGNTCSIMFILQPTSLYCITHGIPANPPATPTTTHLIAPALNPPPTHPLCSCVPRWLWWRRSTPSPCGLSRPACWASTCSTSTSRHALDCISFQGLFQYVQPPPALPAGTVACVCLHVFACSPARSTGSCIHSHTLLFWLLPAHC